MHLQIGLRRQRSQIRSERGQIPLAQLVRNLGQRTESATYCHTTLQRQLARRGQPGSRREGCGGGGGVRWTHRVGLSCIR